MILHGIDTSYANGYVNWDGVKHARNDFAITKASEGTGIEDETLAHNWPSIRYRGLERVAYHFWYDNLDSRGQVDNYHRAVRNAGHFMYGDGACIDVEEASISGIVDPVERLVEVVELVRHDIDKPILIYTNYDTWVNRMGNPVRSEFHRCILWLASYSPYTQALSQWPNGLSFWQYSDTGYCPGVFGQVDLDRFYGSRQQLRQLLRSSP